MHHAHLCLCAPHGDTAALHLLDTALALREDLQALGVTVTLTRQQLRADAVNLVLGAQHGFDADAAAGHAWLLVNTQPVRADGAGLGPAALRLCRRHPLIDVSAAHLAALRQGQAPGVAAPSALWQPGVAPSPSPTPALDARPIGLLLARPPTPRQQALLGGFAQAGVAVARLDQPLAGPELAAMMSQARAVLCLLAEDDAAPDVAAMALALRAGTAVLAERPASGALPTYPSEDAVMWFEPTAAGLAAALRGGPMSTAFAEAAQASLQAWAAAAPAEPARAAWTLCQAVWAQHRAAQDAAPLRRPDRLRRHAAGDARRPGWWHVAAQPGPGIDEALDLCAEPAADDAARGLSLIDAGAWDPQRADTAALPRRALGLLADGGRLVLQVRLAAPSPTDAEARRAALRETLAPWTHEFWRSGLLAHRGALEHVGWLDADGLPLAPDQAHRAGTARVVLRRCETRYQERSQARALRDDFGLPA